MHLLLCSPSDCEFFSIKVSGSSLNRNDSFRIGLIENTPTDVTDMTDVEECNCTLCYDVIKLTFATRLQSCSDPPTICEQRPSLSAHCRLYSRITLFF